MPIKNPLSDVMSDWSGGNVKRGYNAAEGLGGELAAKARMVAQGREALKPTAPEPAKPFTPAEGGPNDRVKPGAKFGDRPGEKRLDLSDVKPLGTFKKGGEVPKTGAYKMHKGEQVLTPEQKNHMHNMLSLAEGPLSQEAPPEPEPPKKEVREMRIRKGASGGHIIQHSHVHMHLHPDEEHVTSDGKGLMKHIMEHMAGESEAEDENTESPELQKMEQAAGVK